MTVWSQLLPSFALLTLAPTPSDASLVVTRDGVVVLTCDRGIVATCVGEVSIGNQCHL